MSWEWVRREQASLVRRVGEGGGERERERERGGREREGERVGGGGVEEGRQTDKQADIQRLREHSAQF